MDEKDIEELARRFRACSVRLIMQRPETFLPLFATEDGLPTPEALEKAVSEGYPEELSPAVGLVVGTFYALNAIGRRQGSFLYRALFRSGGKEGVQEAYSRSAYYRIRKKAIEDLCRLLQD